MTRRLKLYVHTPSDSDDEARDGDSDGDTPGAALAQELGRAASTSFQVKNLSDAYALSFTVTVCVAAPC